VRLPGGLEPGRLERRRLADLREALADPDAEGPDPAYYMYQGVAHFTAKEGRQAYHWRYDLTVLPPGRYGDEYLRTVGHYHPLIKGKAVAWPEVYEVLHGSALFVQQRVDDYRAGPDTVRVDEVILLRAEAGEKAIMLPGYGHWTVNVTPEPLVFSNWISADFSSYYESAIRARGPCCHVKVGPRTPKYARNRLYLHVPAKLKHARPVAAPELGLVPGRPILRELQQRPERWTYLCDSEQAAVSLRSAMRITRAEPFPR